MHIDVDFLKRNFGVLHRDRSVLEQYDPNAKRWRTVADGNNKSGHSVNGSRITLTDGEPPLLRFVNYSMPMTPQSSMKRDRYNIYGKLAGRACAAWIKGKCGTSNRFEVNRATDRPW